MRTRNVLGLILGAIVLALMVTADAGAWGKKKEQCRHDGREKLFEELDLEAGQKEKLDALHESHWDTMKQMKKDRKALAEDLEALVDNGASDGEILVKVDALVDNWKSFRSSMDEHIEEIRSILTPVQQARLAMQLAEKGGHHGHGCRKCRKED